MTRTQGTGGVVVYKGVGSYKRIKNCEVRSNSASLFDGLLKSVGVFLLIEEGEAHLAFVGGFLLFPLLLPRLVGEVNEEGHGIFTLEEVPVMPAVSLDPVHQ